MESFYHSLWSTIARSNTRELRIAQRYKNIDSGAGTSPRMRIRNDFWYRHQEIRKLHLEYAQIDPQGIEIVHLVAFPETSTDLPILGVDVVATQGRVSMSIADPTPATMDLTVPDEYAHGVDALAMRHGIRDLRRQYPRDPPDWGTEIFGPRCVLLSGCPLDRFAPYALDLVEHHLMYHPEKVVSNGSKENAARALRRYSRQQRKNTKTQNMLRACFGDEFAKDYMATVMFDTIL
jgi:hypothetical protein